MLTRLIYASTATDIVETAWIDNILKAARAFNLENDVTGLLCEGGGKFLQYIEGDRVHINELYCRLLHDRRHKDLVLLDYTPIDARTYANWSMGFVSIHNPKIHGIVTRLTHVNSFKPDELTAQQAIDLVTILKSELTQIAL